MLELNKIYNIDCLEGLKKLDDNSIDLITSPPYNKGTKNRKQSKYDTWKNAGIKYDVYEDNLSEYDYVKWQQKIIDECIRVLKPNGSFFYNHKYRIKNHKIIDPMNWLNKYIIKQIIIWNRKSTPVLEPIRFFPIYENIYWIIKTQSQPKFNSYFAKYTNIWNINFETNNKHPAPFPIEIPKRIIKSTTNENDIVLDPFMGSGTTAVACKELQRNFIGFEISKKYCDIAEERLDKWKGQKRLF